MAFHTPFSPRSLRFFLHLFVNILKTVTMRLRLALFLTFCLSSSLKAQEHSTNHPNSTLRFTVIKDNAATPVKNQNRSSTCWSFSTLSFFESELIRMKKPKVELAEMYVVRMVYLMKALKYVRMHGTIGFAPGGAFHDPITVLATYGLMPRQAYPGNEYGTTDVQHGELDELLLSYVQAVVRNKNGQLSTAWQAGLEGILDAYLGKVPAQFEFQGKTYTPRSFADFLGLKPQDYIDLTSFSHHPFYTQFAIEVPDNWSWDKAYNLPLNEWMETLDYALMNGFTAAWGADVSGKGFSHKFGLALEPVQYPAADKAEVYFMEPQEEKQVTQALRQADFDNYLTTDDHGMHITGMVKDQHGKKYYIVKNSWGHTSNGCGGYFYASEAYVQMRTLNFMIHRDGIPAHIRKKLGI
jgi:bleomycin hydrolase